MESERHIGTVKWFGNREKKIDYGFIESNKYGDLFFHKKSIYKKQRLDLFEEDELVIFVVKESEGTKGKYRAVNVVHISHEKDINFLFDQLLSLLRNNQEGTYLNNVQKKIVSRLVYLIHYSKENDLVKTCFQTYTNFIKQALLEDRCNLYYKKNLILSAKEMFPGFIESLETQIYQTISTKTSHELWLLQTLSVCQIDYIVDLITNNNNEDIANILTKCSIQEKREIFRLITKRIKQDRNNIEITFIIKMLLLIKDHNLQEYESFLNEILQICSDYEKLLLWLDNIHQELDFQSYRNHLIKLSPERQQKFTKKVFKHIHDGNVNITLDELISINSICIPGYNLDYTTSIVLDVINELQKGRKFDTRGKRYSAEKKIYDLIIQHLKNPEESLKIKGYFDYCEGRLISRISSNYDPNGEITREIYYERLSKRPFPLCEGRKAINSETNEPLLSTNEQIEFWWCANQPCFKPSRKIHTPAEWEKYTFVDFLEILKIFYRQEDIEIFYGFINKANRFLEHLKCYNCGHVLYPKDQSNYAFYRVTHFVCKNNECFEKGKDIYLSHCLNGRCKSIIDSRECVRCHHENYSEEYGLYVCNYCLSCCNTAQLERRRWVNETIRNIEYKGTLVGHKDLGEISCNLCGNKMKSIAPDKVYYQKVLNWLIDNRRTHNRIYNSGQNNGRWWFVLRRGNEDPDDWNKRLTRYQQLGFQVPSLGETKDFHLVSEPINYNSHAENTLKCDTCENVINLNLDHERALVLKSYHNIFFSLEDI